MSPATTNPSARNRAERVPRQARSDAPAPRVRKADLPSKTCAVCGHPFSWRKKWRTDWDRVKYCSAKCRSRGTRETTT
ncbi:DUF2256 domain-containing protein [Palleronia rufa]|uniref:DUF2256 domain-containing protein n=1 Tax=Palleronia rufa TaxID=1530186 RepID=UPI0009DFEF27|nr:DUF2256 domain-containing protein [Palleronia rufa]